MTDAQINRRMWRNIAFAAVCFAGCAVAAALFDGFASKWMAFFAGWWLSQCFVEFWRAEAWKALNSWRESLFRPWLSLGQRDHRHDR